MTNEERITRAEAEIDNLKNNNIKIWQQVSNHIPTQIKELDIKNDACHRDIYNKVDSNGRENRELTNKIIWYIAIGLVATTMITILTQIFLKSLN